LSSSLHGAYFAVRRKNSLAHKSKSPCKNTQFSALKYLYPISSRHWEVRTTPGIVKSTKNLRTSDQAIKTRNSQGAMTFSGTLKGQKKAKGDQWDKYDSCDFFIFQLPPWHWSENEWHENVLHYLLWPLGVHSPSNEHISSVSLEHLHEVLEFALCSRVLWIVLLPVSIQEPSFVKSLALFLSFSLSAVHPTASQKSTRNLKRTWAKSLLYQAPTGFSGLTARKCIWQKDTWKASGGKQSVHVRFKNFFSQFHETGLTL